MRQTLGIVTIRMFNLITNFNRVPSIPNNQSVYLKKVYLFVWCYEKTTPLSMKQTVIQLLKQWGRGPGGATLTSPLFNKIQVLPASVP